MTSSLRLLVLAAAAGWVFLAVLFHAAAGADATKPPAKGYALHEWGVFTVYPEVELANAARRTEWASMPPFFYGQTDDRHIPFTLNANKPVIYFHATEPVDLTLRVDFLEGGLPAVWWPATSTPSMGGGRIMKRRVEAAPARFLEWTLRLQAPPPQVGNAGPLREPGERGAWVKRLRDAAVDDVYAWAIDDGLQHEKFVFYDGVLPRGKWAEVSVAKEKVTVRNVGKPPLHDVTAVEVRPGGAVRVARFDKLEGEAEAAALEFHEVDKAKWPAEGEKTLIQQLADAGLNVDEATALAKVWERELFQTEGLTVFYRLTQEEYDRLLPLTAKPAPEKTVRVGLVVHSDCGADLAERVAALVKQLEDPEFGQREEAQKQLEALGRPAVGPLLRLRGKSISLELKRRIDDLVRKYESATGLPPFAAEPVEKK
jgi:hypothetical protein